MTNPIWAEAVGSIDKRTLEGKQVQSLIDAAEQHIAQRVNEVEAEKLRAVKIAQELQDKLEAANNDKLELTTRLEVKASEKILKEGNALTCTYQHPHASPKYDYSTWWNLSELEDMCSQLRYLGAEDNTSISVNKEKFTCIIEDYGIAPLKKKDIVTPPPTHKSRIKNIKLSESLALSMGYVFVILLAISIFFAFYVMIF